MNTLNHLLSKDLKELEKDKFNLYYKLLNSGIVNYKLLQDRMDILNILKKRGEENLI